MKSQTVTVEPEVDLLAPFGDNVIIGVFKLMNGLFCKLDVEPVTPVEPATPVDVEPVVPLD